MLTHQSVIYFFLKIFSRVVKNKLLLFNQHQKINITELSLIERTKYMCKYVHTGIQIMTFNVCWGKRGVRAEILHLLLTK
jgi:hypothetical protein